jgi:transcriptional regulator with PAS, ATPase and Fis domain
MADSTTFAQDVELDRWRQKFAPGILGDDPRLAEVLRLVRNVADTDCTVLITGESGTGKELLARAVHAGSLRKDGPFVPLNCAAIPESLIEAELFGHVRGAYTGAIAAREGRIASAHGGTLFLDEIGDLPPSAQAKLLRMLQDLVITPLGSDRPLAIDVRIVAATNQDLERMVDEGKFRADLYYRLSVIPVQVPPLRERAGDVVVLARQFLAAANQRNGRGVDGFEESAERALAEHRWPGNVRELMHMVERAVLLKGQGRIRASDLPLARIARGTGTHRVTIPTEGLDLRRAMDEVERQLIDEALERTGGNRTEAAALLGLNRTTLVEKIRKHKAA